MLSVCCCEAKEIDEAKMAKCLSMECTEFKHWIIEGECMYGLDNQGTN